MIENDSPHLLTDQAREKIHCDQYGRVKVQFHCDREVQGDNKHSCWLHANSNPQLQLTCPVANEAVHVARHIEISGIRYV